MLNPLVDGFWSMTMYDAEGYMVKNEYDSYSINNISAKKIVMVQLPFTSEATQRT
jgi:hypothetical protein